jgi:hypothetical protein
MPVLQAQCKCGRVYFKWRAKGDWDTRTTLAACHQCASKPWHDPKQMWSRDAQQYDGSLSRIESNDE